jgi:predicted DsbA family dithiol-disulfide isomerase
MRIDFVSDVVCPWCAIGLAELETALSRLKGVVEPDIHLQPFELNPSLPAEGQSLTDLMREKFGNRPPEQMKAAREAVQTRAASVGFTIAMDDNSRMYNTFDAHRLIHWAELQGKGLAMKHALFATHFTEGGNIADYDTLAAKAASIGLDPAKAREVLESGRYTKEVKDAEFRWKAAGINSVPSIIIDGKYLISGGQTADVFEQGLRQIAMQAAAE